MFCPNCGNENDPNDNFCKSCGADLHSNAQNANYVNPNKKNSSNAVSGFVCSLVGMFILGFLCILGLVLCSKALKEAKQTGAPTGLATAGFVLGIIGTCGWVLGVILLSASGAPIA